ncbi:MAG: hypothetical protein AMK73_07195 [Planctomycetes bacterium SM23_32]|nr:MAG: hypothetical protein AMK73_07195 [Planctomycetes bacterium SM23_32]
MPATTTNPPSMGERLRAVQVGQGAAFAPTHADNGHRVLLGLLQRVALGPAVAGNYLAGRHQDALGRVEGTGPTQPRQHLFRRRFRQMGPRADLIRHDVAELPVAGDKLQQLHKLAVGDELRLCHAPVSCLTSRDRWNAQGGVGRPAGTRLASRCPGGPKLPNRTC